MRFSKHPSLISALSMRPDAHAVISGDASHPHLFGYADFYAHKNGTLLIAELWGLPYDSSPCTSNIFAMHIHDIGECDGGAATPFSGAGGHYNPHNCPHPAHAGDLPPLFGNQGYAWQGFYTQRFTVKDIVGKTLIIHSQRDDFTTQPAGDAGQRIGCGIIKSNIR